MFAIFFANCFPSPSSYALSKMAITLLVDDSMRGEEYCGYGMLFYCNFCKNYCQRLKTKRLTATTTVKEEICVPFS